MNRLLMMGLLCIGSFSAPEKAPVALAGQAKETGASFEPAPCILIFVY